MGTSTRRFHRPAVLRIQWLILSPALILGVLLLLLPKLAVETHRAAAPQSSDSLVYMADDDTSSSYWLVDAQRPSTRKLLQSVPHAPHWSGQSALAPDSSVLAYTVLQPNQADPDREAELMLLSIGERRSTLLATGVDLRSPLVWSPESSAIVYTRVSDGRQDLWRQPVNGGEPTLLASPATGEVLLPFAFESSDSILAARYGQQGTDLLQISLAGEERPIQHISDSTARGFTLAPNHASVGFLSPDGPGTSTFRGAALDVGSGSIARLPAGWGELVGLAWTPAGGLVSGSAGAGAAVRDESGRIVFASGGSGFNQPLAWSSSGRYLAIRRFTGVSGEEPGAASEVVLNPDGTVFGLTTGQPVRFVGWLGSQAGHS
jgi:hypothetical protein